MKAKDLAAILMKTPDLDVFVEDYHCPDFDEGSYYTKSIEGTQKTPGGIFLTFSDDDVYVQSPSDVPKLNSIRIFMNDGTWFKFGNDSGSTDELEYFADYGYISSYVGWHDGTYTLYSEGSTDGDSYIKSQIEKHGNTSYKSDEVDFVEILTEYDQDTWELTWQKFKLEEALEFVKHTGK